MIRIALLSLLALGCSSSTAVAPARPSTPTPTVVAPEPATPVSASAVTDLAAPSTPTAGLTLRRVQHGERTFRVAEVDLRVAELALYGQTPGHGGVRTFSALRDHLASRGRELVWGTNAGIFGKDHRPLGLHVEAGEVLRPVARGSGAGNFYLLPNGVFTVTDTGAAVTPTSRYVDGPARIATQSGPLLLDGGALHPAFREESPNILLRSGVGVRDPHTVIFAISEGGVRFWELATLFRDGLGCADGLYLDGVISQWVDPEHPPDETDGGFAGMFVVTAPESSSAGRDSAPAPR